MHKASEYLERIVNVIYENLGYVDSVLREKDSAREDVIKLSREVTRLSSSIIRAVHRGEVSSARSSLGVLREIINRLNALLDNHPELKYSGLVYNCLAEYVEAYMFYSIIVEKSVPSLSELSVPIVPYLQGLGDLVGEIRRYIVRLLDELRVEEAEIYLELMEGIYEGIRRLDYPDALIPGVRHKVDIASKLVEDTRVLILNTKNSIRCLERYREPSK